MFLILTALFFSSCASYDKKDLVATPYEVYKSYSESLKEKNYKHSANMLSNTIKNEYKQTYDYNESFPFFSSIDAVVTKEVVYYQEELDSKSCLTINGYNSAGEPTTLNFELIKENNEWKFSYVQMMYHESKQEYPSSVMCPKKPQE